MITSSSFLASTSVQLVIQTQKYGWVRLGLETNAVLTTIIKINARSLDPIKVSGGNWFWLDGTQVSYNQGLTVSVAPTDVNHSSFDWSDGSRGKGQRRRAAICNRERTPRSTHGLAAFTHRFGGG